MSRESIQIQKVWALVGDRLKLIDPYLRHGGNKVPVMLGDRVGKGKKRIRGFFSTARTTKTLSQADRSVLQIVETVIGELDLMADNLQLYEGLGEFQKDSLLLSIDQVLTSVGAAGRNMLHKDGIRLVGHLFTQPTKVIDTRLTEDLEPLGLRMGTILNPSVERWFLRQAVAVD